MIRKVKAFIKNSSMLTEGDRVVVGVSGGADSICLLHVLFLLGREYKLTLYAVHINHGIRGNEADRDEKFVKALCSRYGIEFQSFHYDVRRTAKEEGLSEEEAGRKVRYQAFLETCRENKCNKLAIAHNKNDNAETVLFNLFRGSGIRGLSGIEPSRVFKTSFGEVTLIRPLLCVTRGKIEEYLSEEGLSYRIDSTNLTENYTRNKIRNRILTYAAREINPQAVNNITEAAKALREIDEYLTANIGLRYEALVRTDGEIYSIEVNDLSLEPVVIQKGIVRLILRKLAGLFKDLEAKHVDAALALTGRQVGRQVHLPYGIVALREYNNIKFYRGPLPDRAGPCGEHMEPIPVRIPGITDIPQKRKILETKIINYKKNEPIPKSSCMKWFDYDKIENAVEIRTRRAGDYIQINASGGRKKLRNYFIDQKIPQKQRDNQLLITDGNHVMWLPGPGERMSEKYKVDDTTTRVLLMKMIDLEVHGNAG